jgi:hypothetical protein
MYGWFSETHKKNMEKDGRPLTFVYLDDNNVEVIVTAVTMDPSGNDYCFSDKVFVGKLFKWVRTINC